MLYTLRVLWPEEPGDVEVRSAVAKSLWFYINTLTLNH